MRQLPKRATFYAAWETWFRRVLAGVDFLQQAIWLGFLDNPHLDEAVSIQYSRMSLYREEAHNFAGLHRWEEAAVSKYFPEGGSILIAAVGGGRELIALGRMGYQVEGFDSSQELTEICRHLMSRERAEAGFQLLEYNRVPFGHAVGRAVKRS